MTQAYNLAILANAVNTSGQLNVGTNATGTLPVANGGTGLATTPTNGQLDIGNGSGFTRATLTQGSGITITNGAGSITIAATGSGTVTSVATGNGLQGGTITTSGTLSVACPAFNTVGSYCTVEFFRNSSVAPNGGSNYSTGTGIGQVRSYGWGDGNGGTLLSGTWKWMSSNMLTNGCNFSCQGLACRVS